MPTPVTVAILRRRYSLAQVVQIHLLHSLDPPRSPNKSTSRRLLLRQVITM